MQRRWALRIVIRCQARHIPVSQEISLLDVIRAVEGDAYLQRCLYDVGSCSKSCKGHCAINEAMGTIQHQLIGQLKEVNFKILAQREQTIVAGSLPFLQAQ